MDEIFAVGDESFRKKCIEKINEIRREKSMIIVSHNREMMQKIVDRIIFIKNEELVSN